MWLEFSGGRNGQNFLGEVKILREKSLVVLEKSKVEEKLNILKQSEICENKVAILRKRSHFANNFQINNGRVTFFTLGQIYFKNKVIFTYLFHNSELDQIGLIIPVHNLTPKCSLSLTDFFLKNIQLAS